MKFLMIAGIALGLSFSAHGAKVRGSLKSVAAEYYENVTKEENSEYFLDMKVHYVKRPNEEFEAMTLHDFVIDKGFRYSHDNAGFIIESRVIDVSSKWGKNWADNVLYELFYDKYFGSTEPYFCYRIRGVEDFDYDEGGREKAEKLCKKSVLEILEAAQKSGDAILVQSLADFYGTGILQTLYIKGTDNHQIISIDFDILHEI